MRVLHFSFHFSAVKDERSCYFEQKIQAFHLVKKKINIQNIVIKRKVWKKILLILHKVCVTLSKNGQLLVKRNHEGQTWLLHGPTLKYLLNIFFKPQPGKKYFLLTLFNFEIN